MASVFEPVFSRVKAFVMKIKPLRLPQPIAAPGSKPSSLSVGRWAAICFLFLFTGSIQAVERTHWNYQGGHFERGAGGAWEEKSGDKTHHFVEKSQTDLYIEIFDEKRNITVRLYADRFEDQHGDGMYRVIKQGKWEEAAPAAVAPVAAATPAPPAPQPTSTEARLEEYEAHTFHGKGGKTLPYRLLKPRNYDKTQSYPLVLFLHGFGEKGTDNAAPLKESNVKFFVKPEVRDSYPCFVLVPQSPNVWVSVPNFNEPQKLTPKPTEPLALALEALEHVMKEFSVDPSRLYLSGRSNGGYGVWDLLEREPRRWAAAVPMCGGGDPTRVGVAKDVPIWAFHGDKDPTVPVARTREMIAALQAAGGNPKYTEYPGLNHSQAPDKAYTDKELPPWLFAQKRP
jgi:predicted peptidase